MEKIIVLHGGKAKDSETVQIYCSHCEFRMFTLWLVDGELIAHCSNCTNLHDMDDLMSLEVVLDLDGDE